MKAVVCQNSQLFVEDRPDPVPGPGQVLLRVLRCGICGSDLHVRQHCDHWGRLMARSGYRALNRADQPVVFGHEFSGEVLEHGPGTPRDVRPGRAVVALPVLRRGDAIDLIGLSTHTPGAYAERVVVDASMMLPIPNGLDPALAALTEPMAVGWHAVRRSEIRRRDVAVVIGCGPVGLAIIGMLKARGVETIVASDFSAGRRALARRCGATLVVDPAVESPYAFGPERQFVADVPGLLALAMDTRAQLGRLPVKWWHAWRLAEALGAAPKRPIVFECVGVPGILQSIIDGAPQFSRIVVAGVCMQPDQIEPALAINKEIDLRFTLGYSPLEFRDALHLIADGRVDVRSMVTGTVGLGGVSAAFDALRDPERHAKILVDPASAAMSPA